MTEDTEGAGVTTSGGTRRGGATGGSGPGGPRLSHNLPWVSACSQWDRRGLLAMLGWLGHRGGGGFVETAAVSQGPWERGTQATPVRDPSRGLMLRPVRPSCPLRCANRYAEAPTPLTTSSQVRPAWPRCGSCLPAGGSHVSEPLPAWGFRTPREREPERRQSPRRVPGPVLGAQGAGVEAPTARGLGCLGLPGVRLAEQMLGRRVGI